MPCRISYDVGPLVGPRSGIGVAVAELMTALRSLDDPPDLHPYVLSFRAPLPAGTVRLRAPAAFALRGWAHSPFPAVDRTLGRPDVIHGTNYVVPPSRRAARLVSVYDCWFLRHPGGVHRDVALAGAALRRSLVTGAVAHCSSHATADALVELVPGARAEVVHLGHVPLPPPPPQPSGRLRFLEGRPYVVAVGTVERRKNLTALVRAFGLVADETELELVVAGAPSNDSDRVAAAVASLPPSIRGRVHVVGRVDDPDKSWLVHHSRVLAYPSLDEGFGFPILEAMGAGTPVVAAAVGSIPEVSGDAATLIEPADHESLAAAIARLHLDSDLRRTSIDRGLTNVARFEWRTTAERIRALYDALAMEHRR